MENKKILGKHKRDSNDDEDIFQELKRRKLKVEKQEDRDLFDGQKLLTRAECSAEKIYNDFLIKIVEHFPKAANEAVKKGETRFILIYVVKDGKYGIVCKSKMGRFRSIQKLKSSGVLTNYDFKWEEKIVPGTKDTAWCLYAEATSEDEYSD